MSLADFYPRNRLTSFLAKHKRKFVVGVTVSGFFGIMLPAVLLGGNHVVQILDSTAFCTETCHDVHYAEAVTFRESPHSEVACASCHVGAGTANLVKSKLNGLRDVIPAITGNYAFPFQVPLKDRRPSSETCEKCHWSEKFLGDIPQITTSYGTDEANTRQVVTHVLKVGGGRKEVAGGIHRHSSAKIWYLPVDAKLQKIAWVSSDNGSGETTEYIDPNLMKGITPDRIAAEKRLMDCMDCHNRTTHLFRPPDELIDASITDGSIDVSLPFVKREALKALVPQNTSLEQAYDRIARLEDFYRVSYPAILRDKGASVKAAIVRLGEIARLTTFDKGLDWNTYADNAKHDKPDADMQVDWAGLAASDTSPGCFRCHGNLVRVGGGGPENTPATAANTAAISTKTTAPTLAGAPGTVNANGTAVAADRPGAASSNDTTPNGGPGPGWLAADCDTCHYTLKSGLTSPVAPATSHPIDGLDDCLVCHAPRASKPFKSTHPWSTNEACGGCHQSAPRLKALAVAKPPVDAKDTPHPTKKLEDCLLCHGPTGGSPVSKDHPWSSNDTCSSCHQTAAVLKPIPPPTPQNAKLIVHPTAGLENCLACHGPTAARPFATDHPWSTNATCATCHKPGAAAPLTVSASPLGSPVTHPLQGLPGCAACHKPSGPGPLPASHVGRPESFCAICHAPASTLAATPPAPLATGPAVLHGTAGLPACTACHYQSGPGPFPASHAGRPASFCVICHAPGGVVLAKPGSLAARAASAARVDLTWIDGATGETGFRVERATSNTFSAGLTTFTAGANAASYSDTTVAGSTTYYYRVFAISSAGDSPASNTASVTTPPAVGPAPAAPSALSATAAGATRVDLTWVDNSGNETGFRVERATNSAFSAGLTAFTVTSNTASHSDTTVAGSTTYYYRVFATSSAGSSTASAVASITTPAQVVDAAAAYSSYCVACHGADRQGGIGPALTAAALSARTESWIVALLASHNTGSSLTVAERTSVAQWLKANAGVTAPAAPSALSATAASATRIDLTWVDNAGNETGFRVERATNNTFSAGLATSTVGANTASYSDTNVAASTTYYYRVRAINSAGDSPASNTASATTPAPTVPVPAAPSGLAGTATSATQVTLSWTDASNNEVNFVVQRAADSTFTTGVTSFTVTSNTTSYSDTTVAASTTYYYRVRASNTGGTSAPSNTVTATTPAAAINASQLYSSNCASCHGANRQGSGGRPALTAAALSGRTESWIVTFMANHNTGRNLTSAQRTALAQWLKATP
jgi:mono/diheme cytochrome c family protein